MKVLISEDELRQRIYELGDQITEDFGSTDVHIIGVLKGSFVFLADLVRQLDLDVTVDFLGLSSYGDRTESSGVVRMTQDLASPIEGKDVLIVEDIIDTGLTMQYLFNNLETRHPDSITVCSLLVKPDKVQGDFPIEYTGFEIPNKFVVGYGLDYAEYYRNLPYIGYLEDTE